MDCSRCLWGLSALSDLPALDLILASREEVDQVDRLESCCDDLAESRGDARLLLSLGLLILRHIEKLSRKGIFVRGYYMAAGTFNNIVLVIKQ